MDEPRFEFKCEQEGKFSAEMFSTFSAAAPFHHRRWDEAVEDRVLLLEGDASAVSAFDSLLLYLDALGLLSPFYFGASRGSLSAPLQCQSSAGKLHLTRRCILWLL